MAYDDDADGDENAQAPSEPTGPRRSTFTPPTGSIPDQSAPADPAAWDDDDLANALADQISGLTGPISLTPPVAADPPAAQTPPVPPAAATPSPASPTPPLSDLPAPSGPPVQLPQTASGYPDPVTGLPSAPPRRSLPNADLVRALGEQPSGDTLSAMNQLESQMQLRQQEAEEYTAWENTMLAIGSPEAIRSIEAARSTFRDVVPITSALPVIPPQEPVAAPPAQSQPEPPAPPEFSSQPEPPVVAPSPEPVAPVFQAEISEETTERLSPPKADEREEPQAAFQSIFAPPPPPEQLEPEEPASPIVYDLVEPGQVSPPPLIEPAPPAAEGLGAFDALLAERMAPSVPLEFDPAPEPSDESPVFIEPAGFIDLDQGAQTGSVDIVAPAYEEEPEDQVDETDRAFDDLLGPFPVTAEGVAMLPQTTGSAPVQPVASPRVPSDEVVLFEDEPEKQKVFSIEQAGPEPTPLDHRVGRAARLFWLWFAANSSVVSVAFGGVLFSLGMSLRQAIVAAFVGIAVSFLPLGLGTLAGKWSGQPTMIVSRAAFGHVGNILPAVLAVVTRLFWGAVLLWIVGLSTARILVGAELGGSLSETSLTLLAMAVGFGLALVVAIFGYHLFARVQLVLSILSALLVIGLIAVTWPSVHVTTALMVGDGPWILVVTGVVLVFSFFGLIWANSSSDLARYQRPGSSGAASMLLAPFGVTLPAFALVAYGALLAASNPDVAQGLLTSPLDTIALMIPTWYPVPLIAATVLSLLSGVILSIYSGGFAVQSLGGRIPRPWATVIIGLLLLGVAIYFALTVGSVTPLFRDLATTLAVPVAAWAGIFAAEMIIRRRTFDAESLLRRGGIYPAVNWLNLIMLVVASVIGFGLMTATVGSLSWQGYIFNAIGVPLDGNLAGTDLGVLVALLLGLLTPLVGGIPAVRKQERLQD